MPLLESAAKVTKPRLRSRGYVGQVTQPRLSCQGCVAMITLPRLHSQGHTAVDTLPRLRRQGCVAQVTQPRLSCQVSSAQVMLLRFHRAAKIVGSQVYAAELTQPRLCSQGHSRGGDIMEDRKNNTVRVPRWNHNTSMEISSIRTNVKKLGLEDFAS